MKKMLIFFVLSWSLFLIAGCQESAKKGKPVETTVKSDSNFPEFLVGVWEAEVKAAPQPEDTVRWGIKFEKDGSISKMDNPFAGKVNVSEGYLYLEGPDESTFAYFIMGPCTTNYNKNTRILKVKIVIDEYMMKLPTGTLEGRVEAILEGPVSKNGKTWQADWFDFGWLEGADAPDPNIILANPVHLEFKKLQF